MTDTLLTFLRKTCHVQDVGDGEIIVDGVVNVEALISAVATPPPETHAACSTELAEAVASAIWFDGYGQYRDDRKWPDDVRGGSQELFRSMARAAIRTIEEAKDTPPVSREVGSND